MDKDQQLVCTVLGTDVIRDLELKFIETTSMKADLFTIEEDSG